MLAKHKGNIKSLLHNTALGKMEASWWVKKQL